MQPEQVAGELRDRLRTDLGERGRLGVIRQYLRSEYKPYIPPGASREFKVMADQSRTPWLPLIVDTFAKAMWADGYRRSDGAESPVWSVWQANQLDARQSIAHRTALGYGESYVLVLGGDPQPVIRPLRVTEVATGWSDPDAMWPDVALVRSGGEWHLYDRQFRYVLQPSDETGPLMQVDQQEHGLGVCPVVRFRTELDDDSQGIVRPLIPVQQRIDATVFAAQIAMHYGAFRQRWATGLAIPRDPETGEKIKPFEASIDRVWTSTSADAKFGDFAQTDVSGHLQAYLSAVRTLAALSQTPPTVLLGELVNLSAEALAATYDSTTRRIEEFQTLFGESWEQVLRLSAAATGDEAGAADTSAQIRWRDTEARSLAATVDALGKLAQMLGVPAQALWQRVPGVTDQDLAEWKALAESSDPIDALTRTLIGQVDALAPADGLDQ